MKTNTQNASNNQKNTTNKDKQFYDSYKYEVAEELGVELGANETSRNNGKVGGKITKDLVAKGKQGLDTNTMKYEFADEMGVEMGPDTTARENGSVGGNMTKTLVNRGKNSMKQGN